MTPLMISSEVQNYAFLVELPVDSVFSENEDIQAIQIDECSPHTSSNINGAIQPMIIASTDSQGNCFVTLQDEQTFNSCSPWTSQNEIANTGETTEIFASSLESQPAALPLAIPEAVSVKSMATAAKLHGHETTAIAVAAIPSPLTIAATSAITSTTTNTVTPATTISPMALGAETSSTSSSTIKNVPVTYHKKTNIQSVVNTTGVPNASKIVNKRSSVGLRSFMRCGRSRMIADSLTSIPVSEFKSQLHDTSDIIGKLDLAPTTKRCMNLLQWKGIGKLYASPGRRFMSDNLIKLFTRHLRTKLLQTEETFSDMELLPVGYKPEVDPTKIKRITRRRRYPEAEEYHRRMFQEQMQQTIQSLVANGHTQIQTVYLDNTDNLKDQSSETMQVLIESTDSGSYMQSTGNKVVDVYGNDHTSDSSIIVIQNSEESDQTSAFSQQNIEVLLAAAGESGFNRDGFHQVIICNSENDADSVLPCASSIIIVPNDSLADTVTETVVSS